MICDPTSTLFMAQSPTLGHSHFLSGRPSCPHTAFQHKKSSHSIFKTRTEGASLKRTFVSSSPARQVAAVTHLHLNTLKKDTARSCPDEKFTQPYLRSLSLGAALFVATAATCPGAADAWQIRPEPNNALSIPTWAIHVSSVYEWGLAMALMWRYADVTGKPGEHLVWHKGYSNVCKWLRNHALHWHFEALPDTMSQHVSMRAREIAIPCHASHESASL